MSEASTARHALYEDAIAIVMATLFMALGVALYAKSMLLVGGTAGLSLLIQYASSAGFWLAFSLLNLPFYVLAALRMGWAFTLRTFLAVSLVALFSALVPRWIEIAHIHPVFSTIMGGGLMGNGLLMLFRHRTGLGGFNILALYLQERFGWRAGLVQLGLDLAILAGAFFVLPPGNLLLSLLGAGVVNLILTINHRPGRYMGMS